MLKIRKEQYEILSQASLNSFKARMVTHLRSTYPKHFKSIDDEDVHMFVNIGVKRANGFGIDGEYDIQRFLECCLIYGEHFGETPESLWAGQILDQDDLSGTEKMDQINDYELFVLSSES